MNYFRLLGDILHLLSFLAILLQIKSRHSVAGLSLKTQILYAIVFVARYLDIFTNYLSLYLTIMKIIFITTTLYIIYLMVRVYPKSYSKEDDTFPRPYIYLVVPALLIALVFNNKFTVMEVLWTFSYNLEAVAILPQLFMMQKSSSETVEVLTAHYVAFLGGYRVLYLLNWIYRYFTEPNYVKWVMWIPGTIQTIIYGDFFYYYVKGVLQQKAIRLPKPV